MGTMMFLLLRYLGLRGLGKGVLLLLKWAVRLVVFTLLAGMLFIAGHLLWTNSHAVAGVEALIVIAGVVVGLPLLLVWWGRNRRISEAVEAVDPRERTIDGKVVPDKLAVAALGIPLLSPDIDYVLRGLPDYGKVLLKLDSAAFEYQPPPQDEAPPQPSEVPPQSIPMPPERTVAGLAVLVARRALVGGLIGLAMLAVVLGATFVVRPASPASAAQPVAAMTESPATREAPPQADNHSLSDAQKADEFVRAFQRLNQSTDPQGTWRDPKTHLLWTKKDNGPKVLGSSKAQLYCESLDTGNLTGWRLPNIDELTTMWSDVDDQTLEFSQPIEYLWSSTPGPDDTFKVQHVTEAGMPPGRDASSYTHAVCVHE